jgi:putative MATE family efflux protein
MLVNALYNMVDQVFIGHGIGVLGNAATNVAFPLTIICTALGLLFGVGAASNFNLRQGEGQRDEAAFYAGNGLSLLVISGVCLGALCLMVLRPMLVLFGATDAVMPYALPYTRIIIFGIPFLIFATGCSHLVRADGSPRWSMVIMLSGAIFNLIFDPVFMYVFNMGIEGIALATTLGQVLSASVALLYLLRRRHSVHLTRIHLRPRAKWSFAIMSLGAASCFNQLAMTVVQIVLNNTLRKYSANSVYGSDIPLAAVGVISKINMLFMSFAIGTAQGCQPIVGYNYGAKNYTRVKQAYKTALLWVSVMVILAFLCLQLFPHQITFIFGHGSEEYFRFAEQYLRIYMFFTFLNGIQPLTSKFFTSIGKAHMGFFISLTRQIIFLLPLILLLPLHFDIDGVLYAGPIADAAAAIFAIVFIMREMRQMTRLQSTPATQ